jgi:hypothetical protein
MGRAISADGLATVVTSSVGGSPTTTYAENIGVMAATRVYSTAAYYVAAVVAILFGLSPKFGALISATPGGVLGGITVVLYGMIGLLGAKIWIENRVDFGNPVNLVPVAAGIILAIGDTSLQVTDDFVLSGIALGTIVTIVATTWPGSSPPRTCAAPRTGRRWRSTSRACTGNHRSTRTATGPAADREARPFVLHSPSTVDEALDVLAEHGSDAKVLAGGQSLLPLLNMRSPAPAHLVDVNRLHGLATVEPSAGGVRVGALARHAQVLRDAGAAAAVPLLGQGLALVAHAVIRNRGRPSAASCTPTRRGDDRRAGAARRRGRAAQPDRGAHGRGRRLLPRPARVRRGAGRARDERVVPGAAAAVRHGVPRGGPPARRLRDVRCRRRGDARRRRPGRARPGGVHLDEPDAGRARRSPTRRRTGVGRRRLGRRGRQAAGALDPDPDIHATAAYRRSLAEALTRQALAEAAQGARTATDAPLTTAGGPSA